MAHLLCTPIIASFVMILLSLGLAKSQKAPSYTFMKNAVESPAVSFYDYIIVGGGTAGCPLAATLSRNARVLLLERGGSPYGNQNISNLVGFAHTLADNSPNSAAQQFVSEDGVPNARARVLGGGSCLNAGFYTRASLKYVQNAGWNQALVNESYRWVEETVAFEPMVQQWQSALRDGLIEVGVGPYNGFNLDHIYGTKIGGSIFDKHGNRHTAADLLRHSNPAHLTVLLHARVTKLLFRLRGRPMPLAHGVLYCDSAGKLHKAYINKGSKNEIILSAGAIGSPQILMLSGVGPRRHLESMGIPVVLDQPMVGTGMSDNPMNALYVPSPIPVEVSLIQVVGITRFGTYIEGASGSNFAGAPASNVDNKLQRESVFLPKIYQQQPTSEAVASAGEPRNNLAELAFRGGFILEKIIGPLSKGDLKLKNTNPDDNPSIRFNYFKEPKDLRRCVAGLKTIEEVIQSKAFSKFTYPFLSIESLLNMTIGFPMNNIPRHDNDSKSLEQYCRDTVMTIWHYHGGCQVGRVVDRDYRVMGVDALRVVDGSTFINSPGTNPQATVMMLGRYMGIKIQNER
ncbi:Glucose-methanol-choline (GMC) oxidoreductase family protein [Rhynchospora pubera]|uniref:Glucose-methanol-choline (GMC) oxidoreductase family protein n=1 Tax=Rhynchospora pubera TaxID=906938 RepID=A0AAV8BUC5_9POAL|nr:Glucose-methanol-choline (GMC) oxidoreductase family protein [Rhynchospora pubera]